MRYTYVAPQTRVAECERVCYTRGTTTKGDQVKYHIKDWMGNILWDDRVFDSFEEGWDFIYENDPQTGDDDHYYDDYFVSEIDKVV